MKPKHLRLFIKPFCGWCDEARDWLDEHGFKYDELDVTADRAARAEMLELTGQSKAPCLEMDGLVLADFGADELEAFMRQHGLV
ncbi:MAG: glutaredoxin family protein [Verrucomicrobia bacterium]|nr:glutaredoxin family protein [Verrucomicrobiota bacterium]